jgi:hypothetical protein
MNNEKQFYITPLLFEEDYDEIREAIIVAQNYYGNKRTGVLDRDTYYETRIDELERILYKLNSVCWKELPEPPTKEI